MQRGKHKCQQLKSVRKRIADENGIPLEQRECTYDGPCRGTCPYCEAEVRYLERALADRIRMGRAATVAGLGLSLAACGGGQSTAPMLTTDSCLPSVDTLSLTDTAAPPEDQDCPEMTTMGVVIMDPPPPPPPDLTDLSMGEIEIVELDADDEELDEGEVPVFLIVEDDPEFPGGVDSLYAWIARNIKYPEQARFNNVEGRVFVKFIVEKDGRISNAKLVRDIGGGCGEEALRVVKSMPRWKPGKQRGKPVRAEYTLPINFSLK